MEIGVSRPDAGGKCYMGGATMGRYMSASRDVINMDVCSTVFCNVYIIVSRSFFSALMMMQACTCVPRVESKTENESQTDCWRGRGC